MPRSGGVYTLPAGNPVVTLTVISSAWANTTMSDVAAALTGSLPTDGSAVMTGQLRLVDGSAGTPGLSWGTETTSGWFRVGAGNFGFSIAATNRFGVAATGVTIAPSGNGGVTVIPTATTQLPGIQILTSASARAFELLYIGATASGTYGATANSSVINAQGNGLTLSTIDIARVIIDNTGKVGIAAPSSGPALTLNATDATTALQLIDATSTSGIRIVFSDSVGQRGQIGNGPEVFTGANVADFGMTALDSGVLRLGYASGASGLVLDASGHVNIENGTGTLSPVYAGIPQNIQSGNYGLVLSDANKNIHRNSGADVTYTIPANSSVAYPIGTAITFTNAGSGVTTIAITTDSLFWAGIGSSGSRSLAVFGSATALKITATQWFISGVGLS